MISTLTGNNSLLLNQRLNELISRFADEFGSLAVERVEADELELGTILELVQSMSLLSPRKLIVFRDLGLNKPAMEQVEQIISSILTDTDVVFYEPFVDKRTAYYKTLKASTHLEELNEIEPRELPKWLAGEASKMGANLSQSDANYLVERVGPNQAILFTELEKLALYDSQISRHTIELLTDKTPQSKIFDLLDATFGGNKKRALALYEEQRAQNVEPQAILALLTWQLQLIAIAKAAGNRPTADVTREAKVSPYPFNKAKQLGAKITDTKFRKMVSSAAEVDYRSKTFGVDIDEALKNYIITL
ncbi:MAG TPA: DNA polymerase III subunit delta [Candidatus Binatia bacterium]|nr:DNA polymerase III subunit delta [Candidatus Binatia bacterium]